MATVPEVGAREPCPCGSGRRYKACHGRSREQVADAPARPFRGLAGEGDWIALREIVPAATAPLTLAGPYAGRRVTLATVLPLAEPVMVREDGEVLLGLQGGPVVADPSRALGATLAAALAAGSGTAPEVDLSDPAAPRLQDLLTDAPLVVSVHEGFDFWLRPDDARDPEVMASLERAQEHAVPTARLASVPAAYWCAMAERGHLRWVVDGPGLDGPEDGLLDGLARLAPGAGLTLAGGRFDTDGTNRFVGSFRAHGRLVPVWDIDLGTRVEDCEQPLAALRDRLVEAVADPTPLSTEQRRARQGLRGRQLTLR